MRKIIVSMHITLDGLITGPNQEMDWVLPGIEETQPDVEAFLRSVDTMLLGRVTYEGLAAYWSPMSGGFADWMNQTPKIVFSRTPIKVEWGKWGNITLIHRDVAGKVRELKQGQGRDMVIFGGAKLVQSFTDLGLIDEYRLLLEPVILAAGKPLFENMDQRHNLELLDVKRYKSGTMLLHYRPKTG